MRGGTEPSHPEVEVSWACMVGSGPAGQRVGAKMERKGGNTDGKTSLQLKRGRSKGLFARTKGGGKRVRGLTCSGMSCSLPEARSKTPTAYLQGGAGAETVRRRGGDTRTCRQRRGDCIMRRENRNSGCRHQAGTTGRSDYDDLPMDASREIRNLRHCTYWHG